MNVFLLVHKQILKHFAGRFRFLQTTYFRRVNSGVRKKMLIVLLLSVFFTGHKEIIRFLIDTAPGSILDMVDNEKGQTALHKAAAYKRRTICCLLIAAGASLLIQDHAGLTPRQLAMMAEDIDLADYLDSQEQFQANKLADSDQQNDLDIETPV